MRAITIAMVMVAIGGVACEPAENENGQRGERTDKVDKVEAVSQALGAPRLHAYDSRHFGGNIVAEDHVYIVGGECSPGYMRVNVPETRFSGPYGSCRFQQWDNPGNVRDCRARIHAHTNEFWGAGSCQTWVREERAPAGSCRDARGLRCGGASADGSCFCDPACEYYGDCCLDYRTHC